MITFKKDIPRKIWLWKRLTTWKATRTKSLAAKRCQDVLEHFRSMSKAEEEEIVLSEEQDDIELEDEETKAFDEMLAEFPAEAVEYIEKLEDSLVDAMKKADADMDDEEEEDEDEDEMKRPMMPMPSRPTMRSFWKRKTLTRSRSS